MDSCVRRNDGVDVRTSSRALNRFAQKTAPALAEAVIRYPDTQNFPRTVTPKVRGSAR